MALALTQSRGATSDELVMLTLAPELESNVVLVLSPEGPHREALTRALRLDGFQVLFIANATSVLEALAQYRPGSFLHDWGASPAGPQIAFHQKLARTPHWVRMCRVIFAPQVTPALGALAFDAGVKRVISYTSTTLTLVSELKMALHGLRNLATEQRLVHEIHVLGVSQYPGVQSLDALVREAHQKFGHDSVVKLEYGALRLREGKVQESRTIAETLLRDHPLNVRAANLLGNCMIKDGKLWDARIVLEAADLQSPFGFERLMLLGETCLQLGDHANSEKSFQQAVDLEGTRKEARKGLGRVKLDRGDLDGALAMLQESATEDEAAGLFNNAAVSAAKSGRLEESLRLYESALRVLTTDRLRPLVHFNVALALERVGRTQDAVASLRKALLIDPDYAKAQRQLKRLETLLGWSTAARKTT